VVGKVIYNKLASLVGNRVAPIKMGQGLDLPYITYQLIDQIPEDTKKTVSDFDMQRFQINIFTDDYAEVNTLAASVRSALDNLSATVEGVKVLMCRFANAVDLSEINEDVYHIAIDYKFRIGG